jgi:hypothetical protein
MRPIVAAIALALIWVGVDRMEPPARSRYVTGAALSAALVVWLVIAQQLASANAYFSTSDTSVPSVKFGLLTPLIIAAGVLWLSRSVQALVAAIPLHLLAAAQVYRIGGAIFLVLLWNGRMPWQFAVPAGLGDVATGCFGIVVATMLARNIPGAQRAAYNWSLFGITDLIVAITMGALTSPGRIHFIALDAPNLLISSFPLVMVPTFAVPLGLVLHGVLIWRLKKAATSANQLVLA